MLLPLLLVCAQSPDGSLVSDFEPTAVQASDEYSDLEALDAAGLFRILWYVRGALERKLTTPDPDLVAGLGPVPNGRDGGVFKLVDDLWVKEQDGWASLLHAKGGCSYYSYRLRTHAYSDTPIIRISGGKLSGYCWGGHYGFLVPLGAPGEVELGQVPVEPGAFPIPLDEASQEAWDLAWATPESVSDTKSPTSLAWADLQKQLPEIVVGQVYIQRSRVRGEPGQLVAVQVVAKDDRTCTLAWRSLATWPPPTEQQPDGRQFTSPYAVLGKGPERLAESSIEELLELRREIQAQAARVLIHELDTTGPKAQAVLAGDSGPESDRPGGAVRFLDTSPWAVLVAKEAWSNRFYSLLSGQHNWQGKPDFEVSYRQITTRSDSIAGRVLPLGSLGPKALKALVHNPDGASLGPAHREAWAELLSVPVFRQGSSVKLDKEHDAALTKKGVVSQTLLAVGHSYLLRTLLHSERDNAYLLTVTSEGEYGIVITWRLLKRFPID